MVGSSRTVRRERAQLGTCTIKHPRRVVRAEREAVVAQSCGVFINEIPCRTRLGASCTKETEMVVLHDKQPTLWVKDVLTEKSAVIDIRAVPERHVNRRIRTGVHACVDVLSARGFNPFKRSVSFREIRITCKSGDRHSQYGTSGPECLWVHA